MSTIHSFEELECWKAAREIRIFVSKQVLTKLPKDEQYDLTSQLRRSSRSISDNISEGFGRYHFQENIQYCRVGRGSLHETLNQILTALDDNYIDAIILTEFRVLFLKTNSLLNGYINYLTKTKSNKP
ncbi:MAG: four helix bundle protein [Lutibacter sp.]|nr:four helix bundle protein [Lutibacter sp.]